MGRIFTVTTPSGEHDIDLSTITDIWAPTLSTKWVAGRGPEFDGIAPDADTGAALRAAWRAYHGTHAPAEPVGVPASAPELPDGWAWDNTEHATRALYSANHACYAEVYWSGLVATFNAPLAVVEAVIAAHRARCVR